MSPLRHLWLLTLLAACNADFTVSRGALGPFRIAAVGAEIGSDGARVAGAALWSGLGPYHDEAPVLSWTLDGTALGEGWDVAVPEAGELGLSVTTAEGDTLEARVDLADPPEAPTLERYAVSLGDDLSLAARQAATAEAVDDVAPAGSAERLALSWTDAAADLESHWMIQEGRGSLLEEDRFAADVLDETLAWDDGELIDRQPVDAGISPTLALAYDGAGSNRWIWFDAAIGIDTPMIRHEGRLFPLSQDDGADVVVAARQVGWLLATLSSTDDALGVALTQAEALPASDEGPDLSLQSTLSCAPADQPFRMAWLAEGRCTRADVDGATVVLEVW